MLAQRMGTGTDRHVSRDQEGACAAIRLQRDKTAQTLSIGGATAALRNRQPPRR
jgi:hypothetical protein